MEYFYDNQRHLVCKPFSVDNLHLMGKELGIKRCWFHSGNKPHYDIPKKMLKDIANTATLVTAKEILQIIKGC